MPCCGGSKNKTDKFSTFADACYTGNLDKMKERLAEEAKKTSVEEVLNRPEQDRDSKSLSTPLHKAAQKGNCDAIRFLLENNANPRALTASGETPLHIACFHRNINAAAELLKSPAQHDVNTKERTMGMTPLHIAVWKGSPELVQLLIDHKADSSITDKTGQTPLEAAAFWANQERENMGSPTAQHEKTMQLLETLTR